MIQRARQKTKNERYIKMFAAHRTVLQIQKQKRKYSNHTNKKNCGKKSNIL